MQLSTPARISLFLTCALVLIAGTGAFLLNALSSPSLPQACTEDAKICPDGSAVGRVAPNCEFAPCPTPPVSTPPSASNSAQAPSEGVFCTMDAKLCPDGSSVGRVAPNCEFAPCPETMSEPSNQVQVLKTPEFQIEYMGPEKLSVKENSVVSGTDRQVIIDNSHSLKEFSVRSSNQAPSEYIMDAAPQGKIMVGGFEGSYVYMPQGYADGPITSGAPQLFIEVSKGPRLHQITFTNVTGISDPFVVAITSNWVFLE